MKRFFYVLIVFALIVVGCSLDETSPDINIAPVISDVIISPDSICAIDIIKISAVIKDDGSISEVVLHYGINVNDSTKKMILETGIENSYSVEIGPFADSTTINYQIIAMDNSGKEKIYNSSFTIGVAQQEESLLLINEFMSHNDAAYAGEFDDYPDWIEIYNAGTIAVDIGGWYLTDDLEDLTQSLIPSTEPETTTIQPGGYLILIANSQANQGILQLSFKLGDDEDFALVDPDGTTIIDQHNTGSLADDVSEGRIPDGSNNWGILDPSTPGGPN